LRAEAPRFLWFYRWLLHQQKTLDWQASHDPLTGLPNRREFEHQLTLALDEFTDQGLMSAVLDLDLDQFKLVNDSCGHAAGDELLKQLAHKLQKESVPETSSPGWAETSSESCCTAAALNMHRISQTIFAP
jgi:PleD family two-component response regulator